MVIQPIDYLLVVWFAVGAGSTAYVESELRQLTNRPDPAARARDA